MLVLTEEVRQEIKGTLSSMKSPVNVTEELVNLRDLHKWLEIKDRFSQWIQRQIEAYGFQEGFDYWVIDVKATKYRGASKEYYGTLDTVKHLGMSSKTERGFYIRLYYIQVDKDLINNQKEQLNQIISTQSKQIEDLSYRLTESFGRLSQDVSNRLDTFTDKLSTEVEGRLKGFNSRLAVWADEFYKEIAELTQDRTKEVFDMLANISKKRGTFLTRTSGVQMTKTESQAYMFLYVSLVQYAQLFGIKGNQAYHSAQTQMKRIYKTDINFLSLIDMEVSEKEEVLISASEFLKANQLDLEGFRKADLLDWLLDQDLIYYDGNRVRVTKEGLEHLRLIDSGKALTKNGLFTDIAVLEEQSTQLFELLKEHF
ncbi:phage anti-repressor protein [Thiovulum sp. ES]|nr:phage anti-repressor protein [Thiovulum sp. ES]